MLVTRLIPATTLCCAWPAFAEPVHFHAWFEGPSEVVAGETATFQAWASADGVEFTDGELDLLSGAALSVEASYLGPLVESFSTVFGGDVQLVLEAGTPHQYGIRNILLHQFAGPDASAANPIWLFSFTVTTSSAATGLVQLSYAPYGDALVPEFAWHVNGTNRLSTAPENTLTLDSFTFRVVPAPAPLALFSLAGLGAARRRR